MTTAIENEAVPHVRFLDLNQLKESSTNPRTTFEPSYISELGDSILSKGVLQPILVRQITENTYEIVDGACRVRAARVLNLASVPAYVRPFGDAEMLEAQIVANLLRKDVHPLEEALGFARLLSTSVLSTKTISERIGKPERYVRERMVLNNLIEEVRDRFRKDTLTLGHAFLLARLPQEQQKEVLKWVGSVNEPMSVQRLQYHITEKYMLTLKDAPWNLEDSALVPLAGSCSTCPKRTGNDKLLFSDVRAADTCADAICYRSKETAFVALAFVDHEDRAKLSVVPSYDDRAKGLRDWIVVDGKKSCEYAKEGVIIENRTNSHDERAKLKIGSVVKFCAEKKCLKHRSVETAGYSSSGRTPADRKRDKERKVELERRARAIRVLADSAASPSAKDVWAMVDWCINELGNDNARAFCKAMRWVPKGGLMGVSWRDEIKKRAHAQADCWHWLLVIVTVGMDAWYMPPQSGEGKRATRLLDSVLRANKIAVPKAEVPIKTAKAAKKAKVRHATA